MHNPPRILIVDDHETNRDILVTRLGMHGWDVQTGYAYNRRPPDPGNAHPRSQRALRLHASATQAVGAGGAAAPAAASSRMRVQISS